MVCLAIVAIIFLVLSFNNSKQAEDTANLPPIEEANAIQDPTGADGQMTEVEIDEIDKSEEKMVSLSVEDFGRSNPFLPSSEAFSDVTRYGFELMAPPNSITEGSEASKVVTTKVSGIMYDSKSPSAILNIEGNDYLVRSGDYINNYKVLSISKDLVTVQLGVNVYKAKVGEVISDSEMNYNQVYNLQKKFGGAKK